MSTMVPYQAGMDIGMTVDMKQLSCCQNIFSVAERAKTVTVDHHKNIMKYAVIEKSSDINNILEISGDISLKAKAGLLKLEGAGSFLNKARSEDNLTEITARAQVETVTVSLDSDATPKAGWAANVHGTHYIRGITYGGDLCARIRIKSSDAKRMRDINASLEGIASSGMINGSVRGQFRSMEQNISSFAEIEIEYLSTTQKGEMPRDINGMLQALDTFKTEVEKQNDKRGVPCRCEIVPLHYLDSNFPAHVKQGAFDILIGDLAEKIDDVQIAKKKLNTFLNEAEDDLDSDFENDAHALGERIGNAHQCLLEAVSEIDVTSQKQTIGIVRKAMEKSSKMKKGAAGFRREVNTFVRKCAGPKISDGKDLNIIIIGTAGQGKSETGNTILGDNTFDAHACNDIVTRVCQEKYSLYGTRKVTVLDTPDINPNTQKGFHKEIEDFIKLHPLSAVLVVLRWNIRFTREQEEIFAIMEEVSSQRDFAIVVFTHGDTFHPEIRSHDEKMNMFKEHMESEKGIIEQLLEKVGGRFILVNNMEMSRLKRQREAALIIEHIDKLMVNTSIVVEDEDVDRNRKGIWLLEIFSCGFPGCFPQNAEVFSSTNGSILMKDVQIGQRLMSVSSDGGITYSPVYLIGHALSDVTSEFINIITQQASIKLSPDHHIYTKYDNKIVTVPSRQITIGNIIFHVDSNNNRLVEDEVTGIDVCTEKGLYAPFTMSGTLVVDGVLASCYVDAVPPNWAHPLLFPVRLLYNVFPSSLAWISKSQTDGIPNWIHWIMETFMKTKCIKS